MSATYKGKAEVEPRPGRRFSVSWNLTPGGHAVAHVRGPLHWRRPIHRMFEVDYGFWTEDLPIGRDWAPDASRALRLSGALDQAADR